MATPLVASLLWLTHTIGSNAMLTDRTQVLENVQRSILLHAANEMRSCQRDLKLSYLEMQHYQAMERDSSEPLSPEAEHEYSQAQLNYEYALANVEAWISEYNKLRATREPSFLSKPVGLQKGWPFEINTKHAAPTPTPSSDA